MSYVKVCPDCSSENEKGNRFCLKCGKELSNQDIQTIQVYSDSEITYSPARTNNYRGIRLLAGIFKGLAVISFIGSLFPLVGIVGIFFGVNSYGSEINTVLYVIIFFNGLLFTAVFALFSEGINLLVDLEANTRQTAKTLERLLRSQE